MKIEIPEDAVRVAIRCPRCTSSTCVTREKMWPPPGVKEINRFLFCHSCRRPFEQPIKEDRSMQTSHVQMPKCCSCVFYRQHQQSQGTGGRHSGDCKRHAPALIGSPRVVAWDWCGDHRSDLAKAMAAVSADLEDRRHPRPLSPDDAPDRPGGTVATPVETVDQ